MYCCRSVAKLQPEGMVLGIESRLRLLTFLYCPDIEEPADLVLKRIQVSSRTEPGEFHVWDLRWRPEPAPRIRIERWDGNRASKEVQEALSALTRRDDAAASEIKSVLESTIETVGIELKQSDLNTMGWPVAIAAAAWIAEQGQGLIHAQTDGWLRPTPKEVKRLLAD